MNIEKFTGEDFLSQIFETKEFYYACNSFILMRVDNKGQYKGVENSEQSKKWEEILEEAERETCINDKVPISYFEMPKKSICKICNGYGHVGECDECMGSGEVLLEYHGNYNDYEEEQECIHCRGEGEIPSENGKICSSCQGSGVTFGESKAKYKSICMNPLILENLTQELKNVNFYICEDMLEREDAKMYFEFEGGKGCCMQQRRNKD